MAIVRSSALLVLSLSLALIDSGAHASEISVPSDLDAAKKSEIASDIDAWSSDLGARYDSLSGAELDSRIESLAVKLDNLSETSVVGAPLSPSEMKSLARELRKGGRKGRKTIAGKVLQSVARATLIPIAYAGSAANQIGLSPVIAFLGLVNGLSSAKTDTDYSQIRHDLDENRVAVGFLVMAEFLTCPVFFAYNLVVGNAIDGTLSDMYADSARAARHPGLEKTQVRMHKFRGVIVKGVNVGASFVGSRIRIGLRALFGSKKAKLARVAN